MPTWLVSLKKELRDPYPLGYFPRKFEREEDARQMIDLIAQQGGEAELSTLEFWTPRSNEDTTH